MINSLATTIFAGDGKKGSRNQTHRAIVSGLKFCRMAGHMVCEHPNRTTAKGEHRIQACLNALREMDAAGLFELPKVQVQSQNVRQLGMRREPRTGRTFCPVNLETHSHQSYRGQTQRESTGTSRCATIPGQHQKRLGYEAARHLEELFLRWVRLTYDTLNKVIDGLGFCRQKKRSSRNYPRASMKPACQWHPSKAQTIARRSNRKLELNNKLQ